LKRRSIERGSKEKPEPLFSDIATLKDFGLTPAKWSKLSRLDKKILHYWRAMQGFYEDIATENAKSQVERVRTPKPPALIRRR